MLKNLSYTLAVLAFCFACAEKNTADPLNPESMYFPLQAGNTWQYATNLEKSEPELELRILDKIKIGKSDYFLWGTNNSVDTLRLDPNGDIWQHTAGQDWLRFAFSRDDQSTYFFPDAKFGNNQGFQVKILKNQTVATPAGTFRNCIQFHFDVTAAVDEEVTYVFAPGVGLVSLQGAWIGHKLAAAEVYGKKVGSH